MSGLLSPRKSWSQPTGDATKLQRLQRLQGPFPPAGLQSRKKLYPPSASHLAGVEGVVVGGGGETGVKGKKEAGPRVMHSSCQVLMSRPRNPEKTASLSAAGGGGEGLIGCFKR